MSFLVLTRLRVHVLAVDSQLPSTGGEGGNSRAKRLLLLDCGALGNRASGPSLESSRSCALLWQFRTEKEHWTKSQKSRVPGRSMPLTGDVTSGNLGLRLFSCEVGIVTLAVPVLQGGCGSQMRSWAWKCPADSKVWSNYEGLQLLLLSTHSNCSGSSSNKHCGPRS